MSVPAHVACAGNPPAIANGQWDCGTTTTSQACTAKCNPGFDYGAPASAQCIAVPWSADNNTATAWSPINGTCQPWPIVPNSDIVYQTARLQLSLAFSGICTKQAADALGNGLVNDLQQLLGSAVGSTVVIVTKGICISSSKRLVSNACAASEAIVGLCLFQLCGHGAGYDLKTFHGRLQAAVMATIWEA